MLPDLSRDYAEIASAGKFCHFRNARAGACYFEFHGPSSPARAKTAAREIVRHYIKDGVPGITRACATAAVVLYDFRSKEVFALSDREGNAPLFYRQRGGGPSIAFSPQAACASSLPQCDPEALRAYFSLDYIPAPLSIFRGVSKTPPASLLHVKKDRVRISRYSLLARPPSGMSASGLRKEVRSALSDALTVKDESTAGLLLSGGVDSTLLCHLAREQYRTVKTYTFSYPPFNTRTIEKSREVSAAYGCEHREVACTVKEYASIFPRTVPLLIEPSFNRNIPILYQVHAAASRDVRCLLYGYGGDEIFGDRLIPSSPRRIRSYFSEKAPRDREVHHCIARHFKRSILLPYLAPEVARLGMALPARLRRHKLLLKSVIPEVMALRPITNRENSYEFLTIARKLLEEYHGKEITESCLLRNTLGAATLRRLRKSASEHTLLKLLVLHLWLRHAQSFTSSVS